MEPFDIDKTYRLTEVLNHQGESKIHTRSLYEERIGCIASDFVLPSEKGPFFYCRFVQNEAGNWMNLSLQTSRVERIVSVEKGFDVLTENSVYRFEEAELQPVKYLSVRNTIELYLSMAANFHFVKGFYYDSEGFPHELEEYPHLGMFTDSVLIAAKDRERFPAYMCRYFMSSSCIEFYNTIYGQQEYKTPLVIHNLDDKDMIIKRSSCESRWTIPPKESAKFVPFDDMYETDKTEWMKPFSWDGER